jgi:hypothetical protein
MKDSATENIDKTIATQAVLLQLVNSCCAIDSKNTRSHRKITHDNKKSSKVQNNLDGNTF